MDFSKHEFFSQLNGIFLHTELVDLLEGKDYNVLDIVFPFVFGYDGTWMALQDSAPLTYIQVLYTSVVNQLLYNNYCAA